MKSMIDVYKVLKDTIKGYPLDEQTYYLNHLQRFVFNIQISLGPNLPTNLKIADVGGGAGFFSTGCAALGMNSYLIDDFGDRWHKEKHSNLLEIPKKHGVKVIPRDILNEGFPIEFGPFDIITSFDCMEHFHNSPKKMFHQAVDSLKEGGRFVLGVPNCVNLRKRISIPFGKGAWNPLDQWYEEPIYRGHVREPDVKDLEYIANDLGLKNIRYYGRNWLGLTSPKKWIRTFTHAFDKVLQFKPSLCADIYVVGEK